MKRNNLVLLVLLIGIFPFVSAQYSGAVGSSGFSGSTNYYQSYQPSFTQIYSSGQISDFWPILRNLESDQCEAVSDFIIGIPPGGCTPAVVRSDLLAEQNVPVFCQLYAIRINPLIKVSSIKSITFKGDYPKGISGISFHPARAAVKSYTTLLGDPLVNNIGYVVIILKREGVEANMEDWIAGNLTATIYYDAEEAFGTGRAEYYVPVMSDANWSKEYQRYSFWNGIGYLRVRGVSGGTARIDVMKSVDNIVRSFNLKEGETSGLLYFPGYYCRAGLRVRLNSVVAPEDTALLNVNGEELWVREGSRILNDQCRIGKINVSEENIGSIEISCPGQKLKLDIQEKDNDSAVLIDKDYTDDDFENAFSEGKKVLEELLEEYGSIRKDFLEQTYGEEALYEQIKIAGEIGKLKTQEELRNQFIEKYPNSPNYEQVKYQLEVMGTTNYSNSYGSAIVSNKFNTISVVDFKGYDSSDKKVYLDISGKQMILGEGIKEPVGGGEITATKINYNDVRLEYAEKDKQGSIKRESATIKEGDYGTLIGHKIYVNNIDVQAVAYISLIPEVKSTKTEAEFTFNIGIEKRAIELSPEKTTKMLKNLNETIKEWEKINDRLNDLVKGWKGACFATSGILMLKNMISGFSGESLARQKVMVKYKELCDNNPKYNSRTECYNALAPEIEADVSDMTKALNSVNSIMDESVEKHQTKGFLGEGTITNQTAYVNDLRTSLGVWNYEFKDIGITIDQKDLTTSNEVKVALLEKSLRGTSTHEVAEEELKIELRNVALIKQSQAETKVIAKEIKKITGIENPNIIYFTPQNVQILQWGRDIANDKLAEVNGISKNDKIQFLGFHDKMYLLKLKEIIPKGDMYPENIYVRKNDNWEPVTDKGLLEQFNKNYVFSIEGCSNPWPEGKAEISYYESGNVKGLPGIVPFDLKQGWYVMVPNSGGTFLEDSLQGYTSSGDVSYFKICNIGPNRRMENGLSDDLCQKFYINTAGDIENFIPCPSLSAKEVRKLYISAREAIRQASIQKDRKIVTITDPYGRSQQIYVGSPMSAVTGFECQDFMSPEDCKLMFNVCDPVICPTSRCDFGGKMPVSDVIQTGIIGSLILCLPNFQEGIAVPICISGVAAGIDAFISILKSERDCLQWSLETGEYIGICDEITSIYMCEFFWRQLSPVLDILVPRFVESLYQGSPRVRGGGEYLLVQNAWDNVQKSIDYFQSVYAPNAFKAFRARNIQEVGTEICKAFVGASFPTSAEGISSLLEPESPSQFYAQFSETLFSEATVPSTSQYKVYYHIYAGNDKGIQYRVYLKSPPEYSYYAASPIINVKTGFIARGSSADETIDFTAPSGYKELCVVIDAEEWCGFKQVTTDFGINYLAEKYIEEQATKEGITTEKECISGSPSALSMANLNIQSGAEESVNPEIALRGIVRVCASQNPNLAIDSTRWKDVGYCGDVKMRCWLDIESVKDDLTTLEAIEGDSISALDQNKELLKNEELTQRLVQEVLAKGKTDINNLDDDVLKAGTSNKKVQEIFTELDKVIGVVEEEIPGTGTGSDRAKALALKLSVYNKILISKLAGGLQVIVAPRETECSNDKYCEPDKCVGGKCVMCRNDSDCGADSNYEGYCDNGVCKVRVISEENSLKVTWPDIVNKGYGEEPIENNLFIRLKKGGTLYAVKGTFDFENQKVSLIVKGEEEVYSVFRHNEDIIFTLSD